MTDGQTTPPPTEKHRTERKTGNATAACSVAVATHDSGRLVSAWRDGRVASVPGQIAAGGLPLEKQRANFRIMKFS